MNYDSHLIRTWINKSTGREDRLCHRVMYHTLIDGMPVLAAADGYRIHAAWNPPADVLIPSKTVAPGVRILGSARRNPAVVLAARKWMHERNPIAALLGLIGVNSTCVVNPRELRQALRAVRRDYDTEDTKGLITSLQAVNLHFRPEVAAVDVYSRTRLVARVTALFAQDPDSRVIRVQLPYLWDATWIHHSARLIELTQSAHEGAEETSILGVGIFKDRYALMMVISRKIWRFS